MSSNYISVIVFVTFLGGSLSAKPKATKTQAVFGSAMNALTGGKAREDPKPNVAIDVKNNDQLKSEKTLAGDRLVVVAFIDEGCEETLDFFNDLAGKAEYADVVFLYVDAVACDRLKRNYSVDQVPTFVLYKNNNAVNRCVGADKAQLVNAIITWK